MAVSTGVRSTAPVARAADTPASAPTSLSQAEQQAVNAGAAVATQHGTGDQIGAAITSSLESFVPYGVVTQEQVDAERQYANISGQGQWGNGAVPVTQWISQVDNAIGSAITASLPPAPQPVVASDPGPIQSIAQILAPPPNVDPTSTPPANTPAANTPTDPTATPAPTTPAASTGGLDLTGLAQLIASLVPGANGGAGSGATGSNGTGAGNVPGTSTPISSLGALTPIGTPTTSSSSGSTTGMLIAVVAIAGGGIAFWLYERNHNKKTQAAAPPAPPVRRAA